MADLRRLVGAQGVVSIKFGGVTTGVPVWDSAYTVLALAKEIRVQESVQSVDVSALGDTRNLYQPTKGQTRIEISTLLPITGRVFAAKLGHYVDVLVEELAALSGTQYVGYISDISWEATNGGDQTEKVTIMCNVNGGTSS